MNLFPAKLNPKSIFKLIIVWRIFLFLPAAVGFYLLPFKDSFPYRQELLQPFGHPLFYSWANFDGVHYLSIARQGYFADFTQAFFPLYPWLIRISDQIFHHLLFSALLVSHLFLFLGLLVFYRLLRLDFSPTTSARALIFYLFFPTAFFLGSVYTESLFLFLAASSFYFIRRGHRLTAALLAALASATRLVGIFLLPALIWEQYTANQKTTQPSKLRSYLPLALSPVGLLAYMQYLQEHFSDALYFFHAQPAFGAQRSADKLILLYQVIYRYLKMAFTVNPQTLLYYTTSQEFVLSIIFITLASIAFKKIRPSYALFSLLVLITPTLTGTFSSMPRYILSAFPLFVLLASIKSKPLQQALLALSVILLAINTLLFTRGYWIA